MSCKLHLARQGLLVIGGNCLLRSVAFRQNLRDLLVELFKELQDEGAVRVHFLESKPLRNEAAVPWNRHVLRNVFSELRKPRLAKPKETPKGVCAERFPKQTLRVLTARLATDTKSGTTDQVIDLNPRQQADSVADPAFRSASSLRNLLSSRRRATI